MVLVLPSVMTEGDLQRKKSPSVLARSLLVLSCDPLSPLLAQCVNIRHGAILLADFLRSEFSVFVSSMCGRTCSLSRVSHDDDLAQDSVGRWPRSFKGFRPMLSRCGWVGVLVLTAFTVHLRMRTFHPI